MVSPMLGRECANVFFQRGLIAGSDLEAVMEVIALFAENVELAVAELAQRNLIARQNRAAAAEFMRRVARRVQLNAANLAAGEAGRKEGASRARVYRVLKRNSMLTEDRLTTLVTRLVGSADKPAA